MSIAAEPVGARWAQDFDAPRPPGELVGAWGLDGADVERRGSADHGAARLRPLRRPGWGRLALAHGPHPSAGLAASWLVTNGHNASEDAERWPAPAAFLAQLVRGTQVDPPPARLPGLLRHRARGRDGVLHRLRTVLAHRAAHGRGDASLDNLAIGLFGAPAPTTPTGGGAGFVVRSAGPRNGTLTVAHPGGGGRPALVEPLWNVPTQYAVLPSDAGALLCAAALDGAGGLAPPGWLRPLFLVTSALPAQVWVGLHQRQLGQVGWSVDTRVHGVRVAEAGVPLAPLRGAPAGLIVVRLEPGGALGLRRAPDGTGFELRHRGQTITLVWQGPAGDTTSGPDGSGPQGDGATVGAPAGDGGPVEVQVLDDGAAMTFTVEGTSSHRHVEDRNGRRGDTSVVPRSNGATVLAVLPRSLPCPAALQHRWPAAPGGTRVVVDSPFTDEGDADAGADLDGFRCRTGQRWQRASGRDRFVHSAQGLRLEHTTRPPRTRRDRLLAANGSRTAYHLAWPSPDLADVELTVTNPGTRRGEGHEGRAGLCFVQDDDNALLVNLYLNDRYDGASISCFFRVDGYEEVYDAVWTNVGDRVTWGGTNRLRVAFDGDTWTARLDDELVLHRRLTDVYPAVHPWRIDRIGIMANWEFGEDTGSRILSVIGRDRPR